MVPESELGEKKSDFVTEVMASKENEEKIIQCVSNYEDDGSLHFEAVNDDWSRSCVKSEGVEVNITDCVKSGDSMPVEDRFDDGTESMSSFGGSGIQSGNGSSDAEVESQSRDHGLLQSDFDGFTGAFAARHKKLTDYWRRFIRPIMWRCKWIELQIKEFDSQAQKYEKELAEYERSKQPGFEMLEADGLNAKSFAFSSRFQGKVMKRKRRQRVETTSDIKSYFSQHSLFSYFENRKSINGINSVNDLRRSVAETSAYSNTNSTNQYELANGWTLQSLPCDNFQEDMFRKIKVLHLHVRSLKTRIENVMKENPGKVSSINMLSNPAGYGDVGSSDQVLASLAENEAKSVKYLQSLSEFELGDLLPDSAVSSHGEVTASHEMIVDSGQHQSEDGHDCTVKEETLKQIYKDFGTELAEILRGPLQAQSSMGNDEMQAAVAPKIDGEVQKVLASLDNTKIQTINDSQCDGEVQEIQAPETDLPHESVAARVQQGANSLPKSKSIFPNRKRKRGRRKFSTTKRGRR